jgi:hypothetical protein
VDSWSCTEACVIKTRGKEFGKPGGNETLSFSEADTRPLLCGGGLLERERVPQEVMGKAVFQETYPSFPKMGKEG